MWMVTARPRDETGVSPHVNYSIHCSAVDNYPVDTEYKLRHTVFS
jgi:hypothetical protein